MVALFPYQIGPLPSLSCFDALPCSLRLSQPSRDYRSLNVPLVDLLLSVTMSALQKAVGSSSKMAFGSVFDSFDFRTPKPLERLSLVFGRVLETIPDSEDTKAEPKKHERWSALSAFSRASTLRPKDDANKSKAAGLGKEDETSVREDVATQTSGENEKEAANINIRAPEPAARRSGRSSSSGETTIKQRKGGSGSHRKRSSEDCDIRPLEMAHLSGTSSSAASDKDLSINVDSASSNTSNSQPSEGLEEKPPQGMDTGTDVERAANAGEWTPTKQEWFIMLSLSLISTVVALDSTILVTILPVRSLKFSLR